MRVAESRSDRNGRPRLLATRPKALVLLGTVDLWRISPLYPNTLWKMITPQTNSTFQMPSPPRKPRLSIAKTQIRFWTLVPPKTPVIELIVPRAATETRNWVLPCLLPSLASTALGEEVR